MPQRGGKSGICLGWTYEETKVVWETGWRPHRASEENPRLDLRALALGASLGHEAVSPGMRLLSCCFLLDSKASSRGRGEPRSSSAGESGGESIKYGTVRLHFEQSSLK